MITSTRRRFLAQSASLLALGANGIGGDAALAAMGPNDKFDLLVKGGEVLDPSQNLRARRDIGIRWGVIEAVEPDIPAERALKVLNVGGKLVTPGLVDLHAHVYPYGSAIGIPADELLTFQATTTMVSAGDAGANNFAAFRRYVVGQTRTRLYAFVHIANIGLTPFPVAELYNIDYAVVDACAKAVAENPDIAIGVKVRMSENVIARNDIEPLRRSIEAATKAGGGARVMCHIGGVDTPKLMSDILDMLRPGDILTHAYSGLPNNAGAFTNIIQDGRLLPAATAAKQRGVVFDVGHGGGSFDYTVAEAAIAAGATPDTISSDIPRVLGQHAGHALSHLGDEQVPQHGILPGAGGGNGHHQSRQDHQPASQARHSPGGCARRCVGAGTGRRSGRVRRYPRQQAPGQGATATCKRGASGGPPGPALPVALCSPVAGKRRTKAAEGPCDTRACANV